MNKFGQRRRKALTFEETQAEQQLAQEAVDAKLSRVFSNKYPRIREGVKNKTNNIIYCAKCWAPMDGTRCSDSGCLSRNHR